MNVIDVFNNVTSVQTYIMPALRCFTVFIIYLVAAYVIVRAVTYIGLPGTLRTGLLHIRIGIIVCYAYAGYEAAGGSTL